MVDILKNKPSRNRINEAIEAEIEASDKQDIPPLDMPIPKFIKQTRPNARLPDYSEEKTKRVGSELPKSVHKAFSLLCINEEIDKGEYIKNLLINELRKKKLIK